MNTTTDTTHASNNVERVSTPSGPGDKPEQDGTNSQNSGIFTSLPSKNHEVFDVEDSSSSSSDGASVSTPATTLTEVRRVESSNNSSTVISEASSSKTPTKTVNEGSGASLSSKSPRVVRSPAVMNLTTQTNPASSVSAARSLLNLQDTTNVVGVQSPAPENGETSQPIAEEGAQDSAGEENSVTEDDGNAKSDQEYEGEGESKEVQEADKEEERVLALEKFPLLKIPIRKGGYWSEPSRQWFAEHPGWNAKYGSGWDYAFYVEQATLTEIQEWASENGKQFSEINFRDESFVSTRSYEANLMHPNARNAKTVCEEFNKLWEIWLRSYEPALAADVGVQDFRVLEVFFHRLDKNPFAVAKHKNMGSPRLKPYVTVLNTAALQASVAILPGLMWIEDNAGRAEKNGIIVGDVVGAPDKLEVVVAIVLFDKSSDDDGVQNWYEYRSGAPSVYGPVALTMNIEDVYKFENNKNIPFDKITDDERFIEEFHFNKRDAMDLLLNYYWVSDRKQQECALMATMVYNYFTATNGGEVVWQRFVAKTFFDTILEEDDATMMVGAGAKRSLDDVLDASEAAKEAPATKKPKQNTGGSTSSSSTPRTERRQNSSKHGLDAKSVEELSVKLIRHGGGLATNAITEAIASGSNHLVNVQKGVVGAMETAIKRVSNTGELQAKRIGTKGLNAVQKTKSILEKVGTVADTAQKLLDTMESKLSEPNDQEESQPDSTEHAALTRDVEEKLVGVQDELARVTVATSKQLVQAGSKHRKRVNKHLATLMRNQEILAVRMTELATAMGAINAKLNNMSAQMLMGAGASTNTSATGTAHEVTPLEVFTNRLATENAEDDEDTHGTFSALDEVLRRE